MSARANASQVVYFPSVPDDAFLRNTVDTLERLRTESEEHGHHLLASLLAITKGEAEDDLRTRTRALRFRSHDHEQDDGAAVMAQKLARRGNPEQKKLA
jgi:hypothetical protein